MYTLVKCTGRSIGYENEHEMTQVASDYIRRNVHLIDCPLKFSSPDDIVCECVQGNVVRVNECFKCYDKSDLSRMIFLKRTGIGIPNADGRNCPSIEEIGMKIFSKYTTSMSPTVYHYDSKDNFIICEWLEGYHTMRDNFVGGSIDADMARQIGTVMGRNHARSHTAFNNHSIIQEYVRTFHNHEFYRWGSSNLFRHLEEKFERWRKEDITQNDSILMVLYEHELDRDVFEALKILHSIFLDKKESLVHCDLTCNNIMVSQNGDDTSNSDSSVKVVDFERFSFGPTGMDLGIYISNHILYYAAHTSTIARRNILSSMKAVIEAYKSAFLVQARYMISVRNLTVCCETVFEEILIDAAGFAGIFSMFSNLLESERNIFPISDFPEVNWGDSSGWITGVRRRQLRMAGLLLRTFINVTRDGDGDGLYGVDIRTDADTKDAYSMQVKQHQKFSAQDIVYAIIEDDKYLSSESYTEFWH